MTRGFDKQLYILPFDQRGSFQTKMFGWQCALNAEQTAEIAAAKRVIYDGFCAAVADGVLRDKAANLTDEQFGAAAGVPGFISFAVGRTLFWDPLVNWRAGKITREAAAGEIARRYRNFAAIFETARAMGKAPAS